VNDMASPQAKRRAVHLIWAMPIGIVVGWVFFEISTFTWCGVFGCRIPERDLVHDFGTTFVLLLIGAVAVGLPLILVPWSVRIVTRAIVAATTVIIFTGLGWVGLYLLHWI